MYIPEILMKETIKVFFLQYHKLYIIYTKPNNTYENEYIN